MATNARVHQETLEIALTSTVGKAQVAQAALEAAMTTTISNAVVGQLVLETILYPVTPIISRMRHGKWFDETSQLLQPYRDVDFDTDMTGE